MRSVLIGNVIYKVVIGNLPKGGLEKAKVYISILTETLSYCYTYIQSRYCYTPEGRSKTKGNYIVIVLSCILASLHIPILRSVLIVPLIYKVVIVPLPKGVPKKAKVYISILKHTFSYWYTTRKNNDQLII